MELCAISPMFCRDFKKLMTRVPGKKKAVAPTRDVSMESTQTQRGNNVSAVNYNINTQFLNSLGTHNKAFRILCSVRLSSNGKAMDVQLEKLYT